VQVLPPGQYIKHEQYGFGVVTESDAERTTIDFDAYGKKKFVTSLMAAELVGEAPPRPPRAKRRKKAAPAVATAAPGPSGKSAGPR